MSYPGSVNETIAAVSSPSVRDGVACESILRVSGDESFAIVADLFGADVREKKRGMISGRITIEDGFEVEALAYLFASGNSYTGQDLAEVHVFAGSGVIERILESILDRGRLAGPGEFTLRAYLNGKMDLSQAEAVAEIVASSNRFQLAAAERLLAGKLCETTGKVRKEILDVLSLIEAGMDFSEEGIEFVTRGEAASTIREIARHLEGILAGSIRYEEVIDMPSVGLAGLANAGKSSLLNAMLGQKRSIVSERKATTRDVLSGELELDNCCAAIFDCAGIGGKDSAAGLLDELGRQAAREALKNADMVVLCVDVTMDDISVAGELGIEVDIVAATKCDMLDEAKLIAKAKELGELFGKEIVFTSSLAPSGIDALKELIDRKLATAAGRFVEGGERVGITQRHRSIAEEAAGNLVDAAGQMDAGNDEVAAMMLRAGYDVLSGLAREDVDEQVLDRIFSNFCIGK